MDGQRTNPIAPRCVPLSVPGSRRIEHCYAMPGKGGGVLAREVRVELVLLDEGRDVWNVLGMRHDARRFSSSSLPADPAWRVLGWRMADGSMPLGEYDLVDPDLATIERLPIAQPASSPAPGASRPLLAT